MNNYSFIKKIEYRMILFLFMVTFILISKCSPVHAADVNGDVKIKLENRFKDSCLPIDSKVAIKLEALDEAALRTAGVPDPRVSGKGTLPVDMGVVSDVYTNEIDSSSLGYTLGGMCDLFSLQYPFDTPFGEIEYSVPESGKARYYMYRLSLTLRDRDRVILDKGEYYVKVGVYPTEEGGIKSVNTSVEYSNDVYGPYVSDIPKFTNTYDVAYSKIEGRVEFTNKDFDGDDIRILIKCENDPDCMNAYVDASSIGDFTFDYLKYPCLAYSKPCEKVYTVKQYIPDDCGNIEYDRTEYEIINTVGVDLDDYEGKTLRVSQSIRNKATGRSVVKILFKNTYKVEPIKLTIGGKAALNGRDIKAGEFDFVLSKNSDGSDRIAKVTNKANGQFEFEDAIEFSEAGEYVYYVKQTDAYDTRVTCDTHYYKLVYDVSVESTGKLSFVKKLYLLSKNGSSEGMASEIVFNNSLGYVDLTGSVLCAGKTINRGDFKLRITDIDDDCNGSSNTVVCENGGTATFDHKDISFLNYTAKDIGKIHKYVIEQVSTGDDHITIDNKKYRVRVSVDAASTGGLMVNVLDVYTIVDSSEYRQAVVPGNYFVFNNTYIDFDEINSKGTYTFVGNRMYKNSVSFMLEEDGCSYGSGNVLYTPKSATYILK